MPAPLIALLAVLFFCKAQNNPATKDTIWTPLKNSDFLAGTYRILAPGYYRLEEDILFNPKSPTEGIDAWSAYFLNNSDYIDGGGSYGRLAYQVGFWAAITIEISQVTIDLNGYYIGQHPAHNLMNRYFNVIELGSQPFISGQGFHNFGPTGPLAVDTLVSSSFVSIYNGRIGRAATSGIHGIENNNIYIANIDFQDFETSALSLYGAENVVVYSCTAAGSTSVPVTSLWETALRLRPFLNSMVQLTPNYSITIQGQSTSVSTITSTLRGLVNTIYDVLITQNSDLRQQNPKFPPIRTQASALFANNLLLPDSNCYAFSVFSKNLDTDPLPYGYTQVDSPSLSINFTDCTVYSLECVPTEVVALTSSITQTSAGTVVTPVVDANGHIFSLLRFGSIDDGFISNSQNYANVIPPTLSFSPGNLSFAQYFGDPVANGQAIIGKAILAGVLNESSSGINIRKATFNQNLINWIEATPGTPQAAILSYTNNVESPSYLGWICDGDNNFNALAGVAGFRIAATWNSSISSSSVHNIYNMGSPGTSRVCINFTQNTRSNPQATFTGYGGVNARGFALATARDIFLKNNLVQNVQSQYGSIIGFDVLTDSLRVTLNTSNVEGGAAGTQIADNGATTIDMFFQLYNNGSTAWPRAIGIHTDQRAVGIVLNPFCVNELSAPDPLLQYKTALGPDTLVSKEWNGCHSGNDPWWIWFLLGICSLVFICALVALAMAFVSGDKPTTQASYEMFELE